MSLGSAIASIFKWFLSLWNTIPDSAKEKVAEIAVEGLTTLFRAFYAAYKNQAGPSTRPSPASAPNAEQDKKNTNGDHPQAAAT
jgi:hypothetical protein